MADTQDPKEVLSDLIDTASDIPEAEKKALREVVQGTGGASEKTSPISAAQSPEGKGEEEFMKDIRAQLQEMLLPQRLKAAMFGDATIRSILITDPNPLIHNAVLTNPQLREVEVEAIAGNRNVSQEVLRYISMQRSWMKLYPVKLALVNNAKCPLDLSVKLVKFLHKSDVRKLARSKNIPGALSVAARKKLSQLERR